MTYHCFISPIGFGLVDSENDRIQWNSFKGSITEMANSYYEIMATQNFSGIESLIPENKPCVIQTHQKSIYEYLTETFMDSEIIKTRQLRGYKRREFT